MDVLVAEPVHGSIWLTDAVYVDRHGKPNPRGRFVRGRYQGHPLTLTCPRRWVLVVETSQPEGQ